jgi:hypothetical protein
MIGHLALYGAMPYSQFIGKGDPARRWERQMIREAACPHEYANMTRATSIYINDKLIGDLVEYDDFGNGYQVVLTASCRPYSNGRFATLEGALRYMKLVAGARKAAA